MSLRMLCESFPKLSLLGNRVGADLLFDVSQQARDGRVATQQSA